MSAREADDLDKYFPSDIINNVIYLSRMRLSPSSLQQLAAIVDIMKQMRRSGTYLPPFIDYADDVIQRLEVLGVDNGGDRNIALVIRRIQDELYSWAAEENAEAQANYQL